MAINHKWNTHWVPTRLLALPTLRHWRYDGERSWFNSIHVESAAVASVDAYVEQIRHFGAVIRGEETPLTDAADGTRTLELTLAVRAGLTPGR